MTMHTTPPVITSEAPKKNITWCGILQECDTQHPPVIKWGSRFELGKWHYRARWHTPGGVITMVTKDCRTTNTLQSRAAASPDLTPSKRPSWLGLGLWLGFGIGSCRSGPTSNIEVDHKQPVGRLLPCPSCFSREQISWRRLTDYEA